MRMLLGNVVAALAGVVAGMYLGVGQARRYYFRRSCSRVAALTAGARVNPPDMTCLVELPGAQTQHHHLFSKLK